MAALPLLAGYRFDESDDDSPCLRIKFARRPGPHGSFHGGRSGQAHFPMHSHPETASPIKSRVHHSRGLHEDEGRSNRVSDRDRERVRERENDLKRSSHRSRR